MSYANRINQDRSISANLTGPAKENKGTLQLQDNRPQSVAQKKQVKAMAGGRVVQRFVGIKGKQIEEPEIDEVVGNVIEWANGNEAYSQKAQMRKDTMKVVLRKWIRSKPSKVTSKIMVGSKTDDAAHWKDFENFEQFAKHLIEESNPILEFNKGVEQRLAVIILADPIVKRELNHFRLQLFSALFSKNGALATLFSVMTDKIVPNLHGSYNWSGTYPKTGGSVIVPSNSFMTLGSKEVFNSSGNISVMHDIMELFSSRSGGRVLPTLHSTLVPEPFTTAKSMSTTITPTGEIEDLDTGKSKHGFDRGKLNIGTRDEDSRDTLAARKLGFPVEAGRSHTTARMMEMANIAKASDMQKHILSTALFAYWNATNKYTGYPKGLTPVHTLHETMDVARNYGAMYRPLIVSEIMKRGQIALVKSGLDLYRILLQKYPFVNILLRNTIIVKALEMNIDKLLESDEARELAVKIAMKHLPPSVINYVLLLTAKTIYRELSQFR